MPVVLDGKKVVKVDAHAHILPKEWSEEEFGFVPLKCTHYDKPSEAGFVARLEYRETGKLFREIKANCFDHCVILDEADKAAIDVQVCCTVPVMFNYQLRPSQGVPWAKFLNDDLATTCRQVPERLVGLGTLPLQDAEASIQELRRIMSPEVGMRGVQVGSHVNAWREGGKVMNLPLNSPELLPVWKEAERLGAAVMVHPWWVVVRPHYLLLFTPPHLILSLVLRDMWWTVTEYWQPWLVGMPSETTLAGTALILGGVLTQCPKLKVMLSHGGGSLAYTIGRIDWGYKCRPDLVAPDCPESPRTLLRRLYVDSICHDEQALRFLVDRMGASRVMLGSDYPFPLGEVESVAPVTGERLAVFPGKLVQETPGLSVKDKQMLLGGTALEWLGLPADFGLEKPSTTQPSRKTAVQQAVAADEAWPVYVVNAFTQPELGFKGNPAAVVLMPPGRELSTESFAAMAAQMNLSETAFVQPVAPYIQPNGSNSVGNGTGMHSSFTGDEFREVFATHSRFSLRWFSPNGTEVDLCGHGTLATAATLVCELGNANSVLDFVTRSGTLSVSATGDSPDGPNFSLLFPINRSVNVSLCTEEESQVAARLGQIVTDAGCDQSDPNWATQPELEIEFSASTRKLVICLSFSDVSKGPEFLLRLTDSGLPEKLLQAHDGSIVRGVSVTVKADEEYCAHHFESRYFNPWVGINEDPANGSSHTVLAPFWSSRLQKRASDDDATELVAVQRSLRGGLLKMRIIGEKVALVGQAKVVLRGSLEIQ
jgi:aminocarboxymuconate-semialdehyde decarboxylase